MKRLLVFVLLLAIPSATAGWGATNEGGVLEYPIGAFAQSRDNPATGDIFDNTVVLEAPHNYVIASTNITIVFGYSSAATSTANGAYLFTAFWDEIALPCAWRIETLNTLTSTVGYPFAGIHCELSNAQSSDGNHQLRVTRTTTAGSPSALATETISYQLIRYDHLEENMTNELVEFTTAIGPVLLVFLFTLLAYRDDSPATATMLHLLTVVLGIAAVTTLDGSLEFARLALVMLTLYNVFRLVLVVQEQRTQKD